MAICVALLHVAVVGLLVRAFAPDLATTATRTVLETFTVAVVTPPASPASDPEPKTPDPEGSAAEEGRRAEPEDVSAPEPKIRITQPAPAPVVDGEGQSARSGARDIGEGTGAGGQGRGTGSGRDGAGQGGGGAAKAVKIAGSIESARDYPAGSRDLRIGDHVILALTVGTDGRVKNCRVHRPSRDAEADRITCRLASQRFRFRPAKDASGAPVESVYGWRQEWYDPREDES